MQHLADILNEKVLTNIKISKSENEIFSQVLAEVKEDYGLSLEGLDNILGGNAILAASAVWLTELANNLLPKLEISFALSFTALEGRMMAFTPIIHQEKNHAGQLKFASRIYSLTKCEIPKNSAIEQLKVQDPYCMRCTPHVYGVVYDSLHDLEGKLPSLINRPHCKNITIGDCTMPNLLQESDTFSLKLDHLICALQEIGAMVCLRSERILNSYLSKKKLDQSSPEYSALIVMLKSGISLASQNKILSEMGSFDTMNISNYNQDIYFSTG